MVIASCAFHFTYNLYDRETHTWWNIGSMVSCLCWFNLSKIVFEICFQLHVWKPFVLISVIERFCFCLKCYWILLNSIKDLKTVKLILHFNSISYIISPCFFYGVQHCASRLRGGLDDWLTVHSDLNGLDKGVCKSMWFAANSLIYLLYSL